MKNLIFILLIAIVTTNTQLIAMDENPLGNPSAITFREQFQDYCADYANTKGLSQNYELLVLDLDKATQDKLHPFNTSYAQEIAKLDVYALARLLYKAAEEGNIFEACLIVNTNQSVIALTQDFTHSPLQSAIKQTKLELKLLSTIRHNNEQLNAIKHNKLKLLSAIKRNNELLSTIKQNKLELELLSTIKHNYELLNAIKHNKLKLLNAIKHNNKLNNELLNASEHKKLDMINYLIKVGICVDYYYPKTGTALYIAACTNNVEAAKILIKAGADPNKQHFRRTTLFPAAEKGHLEMVNYLLSLKSKINLQKLKDTKAKPTINVNAQDAIKCTSLYYAARYGHLSVVQALITAGADVTIEGKYGTPFDAAIEKKHNEIATCLQTNYKATVQHSVAYITGFETKK